ncbi:MAG: DUF2207 domain-containing protein [Bacteroidetes bacterium]|nr:DUF2207 domain-containing protein [Bacteroidota bacterium]MCH8523884.1 DUF2207 domain-containing protein [Balneolales bacterium]
MRQLFFIVLAVFCCPIFTTAKDYQIARVTISVAVQPNGSVYVTESRTYRFQGSFSQADYILPLRGFREIRDIQISENGFDYIQMDGGREVGTFTVKPRSSRIEFVWNFSAEDEYRTFDLFYTLDGALIVGPEYAEFMWTYLSNRWERSTEHVSIQFILPDNNGADIQNWVVQGDSYVDLQLIPNGFEITSTQAIPRNRQLVVRSVFPSHAIPQATVTHPDFSLQTVLQQEEERVAERARAAEHRERWEQRGAYFGWIILLLSISFFVWIYLNHGKRYTFVGQIPPQLYEPPMLIPPAVVGKMMYSAGTEAYLLTATLFDLARRGYFKLFETEIQTKSKLSGKRQTLIIQFPDEIKETDKLLSYEQHMMDFISKSLINNRVSLAALFESETTTGSVKKQNPGLFDMAVKPKEVRKWFIDWSAELNTYMSKFNWYESASTKWMLISMGLQFGLAAVAVFFLVQAFVPVILIALIVSAMMIIISASIRRRTPEAQKKYNQWAAYRRGLLNGSAQQLQHGDPAFHLIYAIALVITGKKFQQSVERFTSESTDLYWLTLAQGGVFNPAVIASSVSNITASTTSSFSAGGASVGVAGGGAGGGAR